MAKKICRADPELLSEYVVDSEKLHHHPAIRVSHFYWYVPADGYETDGFYKMGDKIIYCLMCRIVYCAKCKQPHDQSVSCVNFANQENQVAIEEEKQLVAKVQNVTKIAAKAEADSKATEMSKE